VGAVAPVGAQVAAFDPLRGEAVNFYDYTAPTSPTWQGDCFSGLAPEGDASDALPIRHLLALEREAHIALALAGGQTAAAVLRSALIVYGNPASQIYQLEKSRHHTKALLQQLSTLIRGYARVGNRQDLELLESIGKQETGFIQIGEGPQHAALVRRVLGWVNSTRSEIKHRG